MCVCVCVCIYIYIYINSSISKLYIIILPMRLMLWSFVTPTREDTAPEVAMSSVRGIRTLQDTLGQSGHTIYHNLLIQLRLYGAWTDGPVVEFQFLHTVVVGSISSGGDHGIHCWWDLIRSKQLFSAPYVTCSCLPDFLVMVIIWYILHAYTHSISFFVIELLQLYFW